MNTNYYCSWLWNLSRYFSPCLGNLAYFPPKKFKLLNILFSISFTMSVSDEGYGIPETFYFLFLSLWAYFDEGYGIPETFYFLFLSLWAYLMKVTVYQKHSIFYFFHYERIWWRLLPEKGRDYWYLDWYFVCSLKKKSKYTHVIDKICY